MKVAIRAGGVKGGADVAGEADGRAASPGEEA